LRLALAYPGDLESRTGGFLYDRRLALELETRGWKVERLSLPAGFPFPTARDLVVAAEVLAALPAGATLLVDGLALGAMPELAARLAARHDLVALVHHPLCLETGLDESRAAALAASERAALGYVRATLVTSARTAASLVELFEMRAETITVAVPGTDPAPVAQGSGGRCRMICVATITPRKGHLVLVEALAGLAELDWEVWLVGSLDRGPATADALREAMAALYREADLCVSASFYEGYGMALAEALACGLPIVAAAGGAVADTVPEDAALLVPIQDAGALRDALRRCLTEPALMASLRRGALRARGELPDWTATALTVERVLLQSAA